MSRASPRFSLRSEGSGPELVALRQGEVATIGRDALNRAQIGHHSVAPFHARLRCDDWGLWISPLPAAVVRVRGEAVTEERLVPLGAVVEIGALRFELSVDAPQEATPRSLQRLRAAAESAIGFSTSIVLHALVFWSARILIGDAPPDAPQHLGYDGPTELSLVPRAVAIELPSGSSEPEAAAALPAATPEETMRAAAEAADDASRSALGDLPAHREDESGGANGDAAALDGPPGLGSDRDLGDLPPAIGVGGTIRGRGISGVGRLSLAGVPEGIAKKTLARLTTLRGCGVDLVFVIDATSSMRPFIENARLAADALVSQLATLIGDLQVGVVAYRDEGDEFVTRRLPLSGDRYAILNFLWSLDAEGGGDTPESIEAGLTDAFLRAGWRPKRHRVVVVMGDAPPHPKEWPKIKTLIGSFARGDPKLLPGAVVSAIYTGPPRTHQRDADQEGAHAMAEIARLGRGDFLDLGGQGDLGERLLWLTLGPSRAEELRILLSRIVDGPKEEIIRRHVEQQDFGWLVDRLRLPPIHPRIVDALVENSQRTVLTEVRKRLVDATLPRESREAALYVLRRSLPTRVDFDLDRAPEVQEPAIRRLDAWILRR